MDEMNWPGAFAIISCVLIVALFLGFMVYQENESINSVNEFKYKLLMQKEQTRLVTETQPIDIQEPTTE